MTVKELIESLKTLPMDAPVILQKDAEGNGYSPCAGTDTAIYVASNTWSGNAYHVEDAKEEGVEGVEAVIIYPVN